MQQYFEYLRDIGDDQHSFLEKIAVSALIFLAVFVVRLLVTKSIDGVVKDEKRRHRIQSVTRFFTVLLTIYLVLYVWFSRAKSVGLIVGIGLALLVLALKDLIMDIFAFIYISLRRPFAVGDLVEIRGTQGEVIDIDFVQFNMAEMGALVDCMTPTGRYVSFPNRFIFQEAVFNYNRDDPFVMQDVFVLIDGKDDRQKALEIAGKVAYEKYQNIIADYDEEEMQHFENAVSAMSGDTKPKIRATLDPNGVRIYIQFFTSYDEIGKNKMIMENALYDALLANGFTFPSPQYIRLVK